MFFLKYRVTQRKIQAINGTQIISIEYTEKLSLLISECDVKDCTQVRAGTRYLLRLRERLKRAAMKKHKEIQEKNVKSEDMHQKKCFTKDKQKEF